MTEGCRKLEWLLSKEVVWVKLMGGGMVARNIPPAVQLWVLEGILSWND